jgi:hypothetical protein
MAKQKTATASTEAPKKPLENPEGPSNKGSATLRSAKQYTKRIKVVARRVAKKAANSSLPSILLVSSVLFARYLPNSDFSYPSEILLPITLFSVLATIFFYLYRRSFRGKNGPAHVATFLLIYSIYGFSYAFPYVQKWTDAVLPSSLTTSFSSAFTRILLLAATFWVVAYVINYVIQRIKPLKSFQPYKILLFAVCFVFAVQGFKVADRVWEIRHQLSYSYDTSRLPTKPATSTASKPNVYYLLFDRYTSPDALKSIYNYDNSKLMNFFADQGFVSRDQAYSNYPFTQQSISSTMSMSYLSDLEAQFKDDAGKFQTAFPYRSIIRDPPAAQVFKQNGYNYNQVSSWWDFTRFGVKADDDPTKSFRLRILGLTFWLTDLERDIFNRSALSSILQKGITFGSVTIIKYDQDRNPRQNFHAQVDAIQQIARNSKTQTKPQFTFAHVLSPHDPYIFAADGSDATYNGDRTDQDIDEYTKYTNQLTYANTQIEQIIKTIRTQDPTAVIAFQPDEGSYPKQFRGGLSEDHYFDPKDLSDTEMRQKFGITTAYYMPGLDKTTVKNDLTSSVNMFPFILNNYLGYNISYLPECNFSAGNKYVLYNFSLMSGRLRGTTNPEDCKQYDR